MATNKNSDPNNKSLQNLDENGLIKLKHKGENLKEENHTLETIQNDDLKANLNLAQNEGDGLDKMNDTNLFQKRKKDMKGERDNNDPDFEHSVDEKDKK
ncbi:hypothetical protein [Flavobacterium sp.]|uniref:hypothetical protein n=1 Tax=Flavobacterium sp. TaxID=239 RepID=UPI00286BB231|nr:hypothetical protein [Flavobacterium sp.]